MATRDCRDFSRTLGSYLDGELEASKSFEIESHVSGCDRCREEVQLLRAMRGSLRRVVRRGASAGLQDRLLTAMAAERAREPRDPAAMFFDESLAPLASKKGSWRSMVPVATAAAIALAWGAATRTSPLTTAHAGFDDDVLAELVALHSQPLPPDGTSSQEVRQLERYVGFPVHPASFERGGARLVSGRVVPVRSQRGYVLQYLVGSGDDARRVSVLVYDAEKIQVNANLAPRSVGTAEVRVGREKGYSVAATQRAGVGYLLAGDLDPDRSAELAAMVYDDR